MSETPIPAMALITSDKEFKERLIRSVKKEVKQIMEEAVTRKFVHQDSSSVISLCAAVECCLSHGLRRRALGLFRSSSTTALLHKVAKSYPPAGVIAKQILDAEAADGVKRSSSSGDSTTKMLSGNSTSSRPPLQKRNSGSWLSRSANTPKYFWIRLALFERTLAGIIEHLVENHVKYYEKEALVADPEYGSVLSHLLVGPCALEYTRMKTRDHYWTDPPADELVQRHRISSGASGGAAGATSPANRGRPGLHYRKLATGSSSADGETGVAMTGASRSCLFNSTAQDYVESLHQNNKVVLLYGKNNVLVQSRDLTEPIPGYLSLHQSPDFLTLKWTPNQLMNGAVVECDGVDKSSYWAYALQVNLYDIVYVHCHQQGADEGGSMVLVGQDGVQRPAIHFPAGGHLLAFLTCLETGLNPHGRLDPPLWFEEGKGKVFPKIKRKPVIVNGSGSSSADANCANGGCQHRDDDEPVETSDYVFRIITNVENTFATEQNSAQDMMDPCSPGQQTAAAISPRSPRWWMTRYSRAFHFSDSGSSSSSSKSLSVSLSLAEQPSAPAPAMATMATVATAAANPDAASGESSSLEKAASTDSKPSDTFQRGDSLLVLCETMKRQIISRAFYGWLAHCRHLRTVRTHLSGLVNETIVSRKEPYDASVGVNDETWTRLSADGVVNDSFELFRLTFYGGVAHHLRKQVWPYLLGHYPFGSTSDDRQTLDKSNQASYETTMSEWLAVEAIIRQRDKEVTAASIAKLSQNTDRAPNRASSEVFEGDSSDDDEDDEFDVSETELNDKDKEDTSTVADTSTSLDPATSELSPTVPIKLVTTHASSGSEDQTEAGIVQMNDGLNGEQKSIDSETNMLVASETCTLAVDDAIERCSVGSRSSCASPVSSQGGVYSAELLETYGLNLHRIDKDVQRCDRNYHYFTAANLDKLRNIMCTYVWCHLDVGYMQGMCDLVAPLLVVMDDEALAYSCFCQLMKRMIANFPQGGAMDTHFANMRSLIQILDAEIFDLMHQNGDYTHFYFCYRWFLLDFKRELVYDDVFTVWETIWAARVAASSHFVLFVALALVQYYRDVILANSMDFTDIIKFFNEMAERHDAKIMLRLARDLVLQLQTLIENK